MEKGCQWACRWRWEAYWTGSWQSVGCSGEGGGHHLRLQEADARGQRCWQISANEWWETRRYLPFQLSRAVGYSIWYYGRYLVSFYYADNVRLACAFYGLTPILVPQEQSLENLAAILGETKADTIVVGAGAIPLTGLVKLYPGLKQVVWVVARTSRHMDWHEVPEGEGGRASISVWHEMIDEVSELSELPSQIPGGNPPPVIIVVEGGKTGREVMEFSQSVSLLPALLECYLTIIKEPYSSRRRSNRRSSPFLLFDSTASLVCVRYSPSPRTLDRHLSSDHSSRGSLRQRVPRTYICLWTKSYIRVSLSRSLAQHRCCPSSDLVQVLQGQRGYSVGYFEQLHAFP